MSATRYSKSYSEFLSDTAFERHEISYNTLAQAGATPSRIGLRPMDKVRLIRNYLHSRLNEQTRAVVPLALYLFAFQIIILRQ